MVRERIRVRQERNLITSKNKQDWRSKAKLSSSSNSQIQSNQRSVRYSRDFSLTCPNPRNKSPSKKNKSQTSVSCSTIRFLNLNKEHNQSVSALPSGKSERPLTRECLLRRPRKTHRQGCIRKMCRTMTIT